MASISIPGARQRARDWRTRFDLAWLVPLACVAVLVYLAVFPLVMLFLGSFQAEVAPRESIWTLKNYADAYTSRYTYSTLMNSLAFAGGSALLAFVLGSGLAWLVERTDVPFARVFLPLAVVPMILPGILEGIAWIFLLSPRIGMINKAIMAIFGLEQAPFDVFSLGGMIWVQAVGQIPLAFLMMSAAFKMMDPALEEAAMTSGAGTWQTLRRVTLRLLLPATASAFLILLVRSLESFEVPAVIGLPARTYVYTSEIYLAFNEYPPNYGKGSALAVGLLALSVLGVWFYSRVTRHSDRFQTVSGKAFRPRRMELGRLRWLAFLGLCVYALLIVILPVLVILWASLLPFLATPNAQSIQQVSLNNYGAVLRMPQFRLAVTNSLSLAIGAATVVMLLTSVIAWLVYKSKLPGTRMLEYLTFLPIAVPGLVLGMALIMLYVAFPVPIYGTVWVLLIAYATKYLPYGMRSASGSVVQVHKELEEAASTSGSSWLQTFWRVTLPLLRPGFTAGWIYIFIVSFREFSTAVLLASGQSTVVSLLVYTMFEHGDITQVAALGVMMVAVMVTVVAIFYKLSGRVGIQA